MPRHPAAHISAIVALFGFLAPTFTSAQTATSKPLVGQIADALTTNPITAPYTITVEQRRGQQIALKGRVGSKVVHDTAVRTAIAFGVNVVDDLIIDTAAAAAAQPQAMNVGLPLLVSQYTYPPPLFGRIDDPFFGMEPPLVTYPPWWGVMSRVRLGQAGNAGNAAPARIGNLLATAPNTVELTIDPLGVGLVRGTVPSEADKASIAAHLAQMEGVTKVINKLTVDPTLPQSNAPAPPAPGAISDEPPPPPQPVIVMPKADVPIALKAKAPLLVDRMLASLPELAGSPIKVQVREGVATLTGSVPTVYEAMLAYRAAERTPGVNQVVDTLQFVVPDGTSTNPLIDKGKADDVEAYLLAQIRRNVGDSGHVDRVRVGGKQLEIKGVLASADDRARVEAILRSMPILRGFTLLPDFSLTDR